MNKNSEFIYLALKPHKETRRDEIKDAVRLALEAIGVPESESCEAGCMVADELEGVKL